MFKFDKIQEGDELLIKFNRDQYRVSVRIKNTRFIHTSCPYSLQKLGRRQLCFGKKECEDIIMAIYSKMDHPQTLEEYKRYQQNGGYEEKEL